MKNLFCLLLLMITTVLWAGNEKKKLPGVEVNHSHPSTKEYLGSPSIVILDDGTYIASMDKFGAKIDKSGEARKTILFSSKDKGKTWNSLGELKETYWCNLFTLNGALYLMGTTDRYGNLIIRKSLDGGKTWTKPKDEQTGLLRQDEQYHTAPVPVVVQNGRIYRAIEDRNPPKEWGVNFRAIVISAPVDSDLLKASSWETSNRISYNPEWTGKAWLEGNVVVDQDGQVVNILRNEIIDNGSGRACLLKVSDDGKTISFNPETGFVDMPGGSTKFTIRFDPQKGRYWSLANYIPKEWMGIRPNPGGMRNTLALVSSENLTDWSVERIILQNEDYKKVGFQYVDWQFDGKDIVSLIRTSYFESDGTPADSFHNSNYIVFKRIKNFRKNKRIK
ncbi:sialidase family protein [Sunxiuqinia elliptica]|uniref:BNR repeat protein n=1 Tax=Sunxiuqinia elliptica TaxID=655355 RepID=A0A4V3BZ65_9BACT|nr:sialidase family protein [Sunxiuqinia elliptica]TDO05359.1 hypothetical protein DET52_101717 [Sunxiuqinia elliptica]TDO64906.1 hypothetical protein DET65_1275 [Sunxiuqinia elliptica]